MKPGPREASEVGGGRVLAVWTVPHQHCVRRRGRSVRLLRMACGTEEGSACRGWGEGRGGGEEGRGGGMGQAGTLSPHSRAVVQTPYIHPDLTDTAKHSGMEWRPDNVPDGSLMKRISAY